MNPQEFMPIFNAARPEDRAGYFLTNFIAEGGEARVYAGVHRNGREVAVKAFKDHKSPEAVQEFQEEAQKLREFASPNIIDVEWSDSLAVQVSQGKARSRLLYPYMVMERADCSVKSLLDTPELTTERTLSYLVQAMEGIAYAHGEGAVGEVSRVAHRDIKPENLLIVRDKKTGAETVKVSDFGIAVTGHRTDMSISHTQLPKGTFPYMAPEQFVGRARFDSDYYSMGAMGCRMLTGQFPIQAHGDWYAWAAAHKTQQPELREVRRADGSLDTMAMAMQEVCLQALAKTGEGRFSSMGAFQDALITAAGRARTSPHSHATYFDMQLSPDTLAHSSTDTQLAAALRTQLLPDTIAEPRSANAPAPSRPEEIGKPVEDRQEVTRRRMLGVCVAGMAAVAVGGIGWAAFHDKPNEPTPLEGDPTPEDLLVRKSARWVMDTCRDQGRTGDLFHLTRSLIPVNHVAAYDYILNLPVALVPYAAADLAQYNPRGAETLMRRYERSNTSAGDYISATRIALSLAYYSKEKANTVTDQGTYVSGAPTDPDRLAAFKAAARISADCGDKDLQDILGLASRTSYKQMEFGKEVDLAQRKLVELREAGRHELVEMLCRIIARDNMTAVDDCISYYIGQAEKRTGKQREAMISMARDLAVGLAPFASSPAADVLDRFAVNKTDDQYLAAADALALALIPRESQRVRHYIEEDMFRHTNRHPLAVGVVQHLVLAYDSVKLYCREPVSSWLKFVHEPTEARLEQSKKLLTGDTFDNYAYWLAAAALKGQYRFQE